jgi:predicted MPP superfamily phosphohydrolase
LAPNDSRLRSATQRVTTTAGRDLQAIDGSQSASREIVWLHLSDLHLCPPKTGWDADRVLGTLQDDFRLMEEEYKIRPHFLFFTGDIAFGNVGSRLGETIAGQYDVARDFLDRIRSSFSNEIPKSNTFVVPGNHDIDRACATPDQSYWLDEQKNIEGATELIRTNNLQWKRYMERLAPYKDFLIRTGLDHLLDEPGRLLYGVRREVGNIRIGIGGLNSAWSCCRDGEKGKLWMAGSWQVGHLRQLLSDTDFNIALVHHPSNWLVEYEDPGILRNLRQEFRFVLHGHEHQVWVDAETEGHTKIAAAACYDRSDKENGYNFVRLKVDEGSGEVWLRKYDREGGGWIPRIIKGSTDNDGKWSLRHLSWLLNISKRVGNALQ